jgi:hypothetical protein
MAPTGLSTVTGVEDDQRRAFKRAFASTLWALRAQSGIGTQGEAAALAGTSSATYARWEDIDDVRLPDAFQLSRVVARFTPDDPDQLLNPKDLSPREAELARRLSRARKRGVDQAQTDEHGAA